MSSEPACNQIVFRDLPGIEEIERQYGLYLDNRLMADEIAALAVAIDEKSVELFGITERDTNYWYLPELERVGTFEEWERHFEFIEDAFDEEGEFWDFFGIDVTDGDGIQLGCMYAFGRQLVCALKRLHPNAALTFVQADKTDAQLQHAAEAWGRRLLREID